jgi:uncharacterized protein YcbX
MIHLGYVREITRYPIKSLAGIAVESAILGWHGLNGDRRFAFRHIADDGGFPWLSASKLPELLLYQPVGIDDKSDELLPTHVRTPSGCLLQIGSAELNAEITARFGSRVELMQLKHGIFDEAAISIITPATIAGIGREAAIRDLDPRRFRANIVIDTESVEPFHEEAWIGGTLVFGEWHGRLAHESARKMHAPRGAPAIHVTMPDLRCVMINLDPDTAAKDARVMKTVARLNQNNAGVYATVVQTGTIRVGEPVSLVAER